MLAAVLTGMALGLVALFPGVHFAMVLLVAGPWLIQTFGLAPALMGMACSVGVARAMRTLAVVYHPVALENIASADPAQRLAARGQARWATKLMGEQLITGTVIAVTLSGTLVFLGQLAGHDLIKLILRNTQWLTFPAIVLWAGLTLRLAHNKLSTALVMAASGMLGVVSLMSPSWLGSSHAMTPLLTGLFGAPILLMSLLEKKSKGKGKKLEPLPEREPSMDAKQFGAVAGILSVMLPGLGTSSLVSAGQDLVEDDAEYLTMASLAEAIGEMLSLILGLLLLASRSSDAAVIQAVALKVHGTYALGPAFPYALMGLLLLTAFLGVKAVRWVGIPYRVILFLVPNKLQALVVLLAMLWVVWHHTGLWGMAIVGAGTLIHLGARQLATPNQAFFMCLIVPMILGMGGWSPWS